MKRLALLLALAAAPALAEPVDAPLAGALGVQIQKPAGDTVHFSHGSGVYLGNGLVLTAAHVVKWDPANPVSTVIMDGWTTEAKLVATGAHGLDLALLQIPPAEISNARRDMKPVAVCPADLAPGQPVVVAGLGTVAPSRTISGPAASDWRVALGEGFGPGNSGGGVFDPYKGCLGGIIIIEGTSPGVAVTQFVQASDIGAFLAGKR